jgi:hypothetical protein
MKKKKNGRILKQRFKCDDDKLQRYKSTLALQFIYVFHDLSSIPTNHLMTAYLGRNMLGIKVKKLSQYQECNRM